MKEILVPARTHGRVLVREATLPAALLVGFHGYLENAEIQMERLTVIPGAHQWTLVSPQALNRFYRGRTEDVVAGWMTRQDREAAIDDNIDYVNRVLEAVGAPGVRIVFAGFSQGVAMAFRAAVRGTREGAGVIAVGGDVPPELLADASTTFPRVLLGRGDRDGWYTTARHDADLAALEARGANAERLVYDGGHEWTTDVSAAAGRFISALQP
ncbi:MAG: phospholipase [Vicinamibacterales bacterium]